MLLDQRFSFKEIIVLDQTSIYETGIEEQLKSWHKQFFIRWIRISQPSITGAMNKGLIEARSPIVLFLDDDIIPCKNLAQKHQEAYKNGEVWAVVGKVIQPWHLLPVNAKNLNIHPQDFCSDEKYFIDDAIGANFSMLRLKAIGLGGFDENFIKVAYRFETEFARRLIAQGGKILYVPEAEIHHLKAVEGGTRSFGDFKKTVLPYHSVGAYYYIFCQKRNFVLNCVERLRQSIFTRYHLSKPWYIPLTIVSEIAGFFWAFRLFLKGPKYISTHKN